MSRNPTYPVPWLESGDPLPPPENACGPDTGIPGLLAISSSIELPRLRQAYHCGVFPWYSANQPVLWWSPSPRMVLRTAEFRLHRSLRKHIAQGLRNGLLEIRMDVDFPSVIRACAKARRKGQSSTWIQPELIDAYTILHHQGLAHSVETFWDGQRVGGLYAVNVGGMVYGESMYAERTDASKMALAALVAFCCRHGLETIDCQQETLHLASLGAQPVSRSTFSNWVNRAVLLDSPQWQFTPEIWNELDPRLIPK